MLTKPVGECGTMRAAFVAEWRSIRCERRSRFGAVRRGFAFPEDETGRTPEDGAVEARVEAWARRAEEVLVACFDEVRVGRPRLVFIAYRPSGELASLEVRPDDEARIALARCVASKSDGLSSEGLVPCAVFELADDGARWPCRALESNSR